MNKSILIFLFLAIVIVQVVGADTPVVANFVATPTSGPAPLTVQFSDTSTGNPDHWFWQIYGDPVYGRFPSGVMFTTQNAAFTFDSYGTYTVIHSVGRSNEALSSVSQTIVVTDPPASVANFIATPISGPAPLTVQFTDTSSNNPAYWNWRFEGGKESNLQNPVYTFSHACNPSTGTNTYPVTLSVSNSVQDYRNNTFRTKTESIVLVSPPTPVSSFTATPTSGPAPLTVQFTDTTSNNPTGWNWSFGDGTTSNLQNPSHIFTISGVYPATMKASSLDVCTLSNSATTTITVLSPLAPGTTTSPTPTSTVTTPQTTVLTTGTTAPIVTTHTTPIPTRSPTSKVTLKKITPWPTDTPTQPSPLGVEIGIIAMMIIAVLVVKRK